MSKKIKNIFYRKLANFSLSNVKLKLKDLMNQKEIPTEKPKKSFLDKFEFKDFILMFSAFSISAWLLIQTFILILLDSIAFFNWEHVINDAVIIFWFFWFFALFIILINRYFFIKHLYYGLVVSVIVTFLLTYFSRSSGNYVLIVLNFLFTLQIIITCYYMIRLTSESEDLTKFKKSYMYALVLMLIWVFVTSLYYSKDWIKVLILDIYTYDISIDGIVYEVIYSNWKYVFTKWEKQLSYWDKYFIKRKIFPISEVNLMIQEK